MPDEPTPLYGRCFKLAERFITCWPLQMAGYATGITALACCIFNILRLLTIASRPILTNPPLAPALGLSIIPLFLVDLPLIIGQAFLTTYAWKAASLLDMAAAKKASLLLKSWAVYKAFVCLLAVIALTVSILRNVKKSIPHSPDEDNQYAYFALFTTVVVWSLLVNAVVIQCCCICLLDYYMWSLQIQLEKGNRSLVLLGYTEPGLLPSANNNPSAAFDVTSPTSGETSPSPAVEPATLV
eukprot:Protomagalhaensia_wolfi_Nauph_80__4059@NODE_411_length_2573_cov_45_191792_g308_i0_p1_GENE_NODE_411_length_2573_cov_45_191792_g308_i0NODE_411_length_2573_cov_45_191792_g308_i0_p1_ORF_typecomplete_len241_score17_78Shisa/PF13908_6/1_4e04Shisa/PF13908_6/0_11DUF3671/PF12420_8/1_2e04DUF3671/PF12420_8/0_29DAG1/PF05454_11/1_4PKD_channel/PF08016_12/5_3e03PKD_channel/PF08016_12/0_35DUF5362/PF17319_2/0_92DUF5362/PF17319_2/5_8e03COX6A/PF02046_15/1_4e04COX6A/PF02046_15/1_5COX6A/PF02046_15/3_8e02_NODE_411_len